MYDNRIIIPSYDSDGKLNYFVGRDIDNSKLKYKNPPVSKDVIDLNYLQIGIYQLYYVRVYLDVNNQEKFPNTFIW